MLVTAAGSSDVGKVRARNEDSFVVRPDLGVFAVADGMGGHAAGDVASRMALESIISSLEADHRDERALHSAVARANEEIWSRALNEGDKAGMGTTITASLILDESLAIAQVGDSRAYRLRDSNLEQLTTDHSLHPGSNILTRALGTNEFVEVDVTRVDLQPRDRFLLCSDGLTGMVSNADIGALLQQERSLPEICEDLIAAANLRGGIDNITAVLLQVD